MLNYISFLNPSFLPWVLAGLVPVIIHLVRKQQANVVPFGSIEFLMETKRQMSFWEKLRRLLLMILRISIFILIPLFMAKPVFNLYSSGPQKKEEKVAAVILIDNSYSMSYKKNGKDFFKSAQLIAGEIIDSLHSGDRVSFVLGAVGNRVVFPAGTADMAEAGKKKDEFKIEYKKADLYAGLDTAETILQNIKGYQKKIFIITDMQNCSWPGQTRLAKELKERKDLFIYDIGEPDVFNACFGKADFKEEGSNGSTKINLKSGVRFYGSKPANFSLTFCLDNVQKSYEPISFSGNQVMEKTFPVLKEQNKEIIGWLNLEGDSLEIDNKFYFVIPVSQKIKVLLVVGSPEKSNFIKKALDSVEVEVTGEVPENLSGFEAVILAGINELSGQSWRYLNKFLAGGGGVVMFMDKTVDASVCSQGLAMMLEGTDTGFSWQKDDLDNKDLKINYFKKNHPVFKVFEPMDDSWIYGIQFSGCFKLKSFPKKSDILAKYNNSEPAILEMPYQKGRLLILNTGPDDSLSNWPTRKSFLPFLYESVYYVSGLRSKREPIFNLGAGESIKIDRVGDEKNISEVVIKAPAGRSYKHHFVSFPRLSSYLNTFAAAPGIYEIIFNNGNITRHIAVNVSSEESDLSRIDRQVLAKSLDGYNVHFIDSRHKTDNLFVRIRQGIQFWKVLLLFVCGFLIIEGWLANRRTN